MRTLRIVLAWLAATVLAGALAALVHSQLAMSALTRLGVEVGLRERWQAGLHDLVSFAPVFALIAAVALLLGLPVSGLLARRVPSRRTALHSLAGFAALLVALGLMAVVLPVMPISAARDPGGLLALAACGAAGGALFAVLSARRLQE